MNILREGTIKEEQNEVEMERKRETDNRTDEERRRNKRSNLSVVELIQRPTKKKNNQSRK